MKRFEYKQYGLSVKVSGKIDKSLLRIIEKSKVCLAHGMDYCIQGDYYRKYKRGKNRCLGCGVKIKPPTNNEREGR